MVKLHHRCYSEHDQILENYLRKEALVNFENARFFFAGRFFFERPSSRNARAKCRAKSDFDCVRPYQLKLGPELMMHSDRCRYQVESDGSLALD